MAQESKEMTPKATPSFFGGLRSTLASQRRQSTRLISDMVYNIDHVIEGEDNALSLTLHWFEKATHINRRYLIVGAFLFAVTYLSMGRSAGSLCNILSMVYPIYASIKSSENFGGYNREHWLMYWIVYSIINVLEIVLEIFIVWLPMYYLFKFLFLCWCMAPLTANGSHVMYANIIRPLFHQHNEKVESALSAVTQHLTAEKEMPLKIQELDDTDDGVHQRFVDAKQEE